MAESEVREILSSFFDEASIKVVSRTKRGRTPDLIVAVGKWKLLVQSMASAAREPFTARAGRKAIPIANCGRRDTFAGGSLHGADKCPAMCRPGNLLDRPFRKRIHQSRRPLNPCGGQPQPVQEARRPASPGICTQEFARLAAALSFEPDTDYTQTMLVERTRLPQSLVSRVVQRLRS